MPGSPPSPRSAKRWAPWLGAFAVAALVVAWLLSSTSGSRAPREPDGAGDTRKLDPGGRSRSREEGAARGVTRSRVASGAGGAGAVGTPPTDPSARAAFERRLARQQVYDDAVQANRYPPDSQPLTPQMTDVLKPYSRHEQPLPVLRKSGARDPETSPYFLFSASKYALFPGDRFDPRLEVWKGQPKAGAEPEHLTVEIKECRVLRVDSRKLEPLGTLALNDRGEQGDRAGDGIYSIDVDAASVPALKAGGAMIRVEVDFQVPGIDGVTHAVLQFQLGLVEPARFDGRVEEQLKPSGLWLSVGLEVREAGRYVVQGLLFDAKDKPIGFAVHRADLESGKHMAPLQFFGLLFHEASAPGPYVLRTVTGYRLPNGDEPHRADMNPLRSEHRTKDYKLSDFSASEWESEQKDAHLKTLAEYVEDDREKVLERESARPSSSPPSAAAPSASR